MIRSDRRCHPGAARAIALACALAAGPALAQSSGGGKVWNDLNSPPPIPRQATGQAPALPSKTAGVPWPRLDPGAIFCRTADDLRQHLVAVAARLDGSRGVAEPPGCSVIRTPTAVVVVSRAEMGRTQVRKSDPPTDTGWTDAFLPDKKTGP